MNRKKHFLLILVVLVLSLSMAFSLVACNRDTGEEKVEVDEKALVANGTFVGVQSEVFPKVPTSWTASAGSTSGSQATPSEQGKDIVSGVVSVRDNVFKDNAKAWKLAKENNPHKANNDAKDDSVLLINNVVESAYRYTSSSINLEKNSYYEITMNVVTFGEAKAFMYVLGDAFAEFKNISTNGQWKEYKVYVETPVNASKTVSISLSNGWGDKVNGTMSKGAVFFDEISAVKIEKEGDATYGKKVYDEKVALDKSLDNNFATYSMRMPDPEFNYTSGTVAPFSPSKYRGYPGNSESGNNAPTGSSYVSHGVVDTSRDYSSLHLGEVTVYPGSKDKGTKMLYINNLKRTAYGYRSSVPFVIEAGHKYTFSIALRTVGITDGSAATLRLVESSTDTNKKNMLKVNTNGEWQIFSMDITGNQLSDKEIYFELWLGEGGVSEESKWVQGTVFADSVAFGEYVAPAPETVSLSAEGGNHLDVSYAEDIDATDNIVDNGFIMLNDTDNGWKQMPYDKDRYDFYNANSHIVTSGTADKKVPLPADHAIMVKNGTTETELTSVLKISLASPTAYGIIINNNSKDFLVPKNGYYKMSMWVKTDMDEKFDAQGLNIRLMERVKDKKDDEKDKEIASFTNINTRKVEANNGYVEVTFYIEGSNDKDITGSNLYLEVMLGSGSRLTPETHVVGDAYVALVGMEAISHGDYVKASTSTYTKKSSLSSGQSSSAKVSNGDFSNSDINTTYDNYINHQGKVDADEETIIKEIMENGEFVVPTAPTSWAISNKAYLEALTTGIVSTEAQFNRIENHASLGASYSDFIDGANGGALVIATKKAKAGASGVLTVPTSPETCGCKCEKCKENGLCTGDCGSDCECLHKKSAGVLPVGYSSGSISLSSNSYYMISVKVKAGQNTARVYLDNNQTTEVIEVAPATEWQTVRFFVKTGLSSTSVKLELYLGDKTGSEAVEGVVAFDNASYVTITEDYYKEVTADNHTVVTAYETDSFNIDTPSEDGLTAPSNWTGSGAANGSVDAEKLVKGVFDRDYTRSEWLYTTDKDGKNTYLPNNVYSYLTDTEINTEDDNKNYHNFLVINNVVPNGYSYTNSSDSKTLTKNDYYTISVDVLTYGLKDVDNAYISLKLNNVTYTFDKVNTSKYTDGNEELGAWTTFTFLVKTPAEAEVKNVTITLGLGKASDDKDNKEKNFVQGYAFFDNVTFKETTKEAFEGATESDMTKVITATDEEMLKPEEEKKDEETKPQNNLMWLYITSGVIGGLILIVVIVFVIKKYWAQISRLFTKNKAKNLADYNKNNPNAQSSASKSNKNNKEFKD